VNFGSRATYRLGPDDQVSGDQLQQDALEKFIEVSGFPMVVTFDADPTNIKFLERYYSTPSAKVSKNIAGCGFFFLIWRT
jgi:hypothetical protein